MPKAWSEFVLGLIYEWDSYQGHIKGLSQLHHSYIEVTSQLQQTWYRVGIDLLLTHKGLISLFSIRSRIVCLANRFHAAKVRISEQNTKQKGNFFHFYLHFRAEVPSTNVKSTTFFVILQENCGKKKTKKQENPLMSEVTLGTNATRRVLTVRTFLLTIYFY